MNRQSAVLPLPREVASTVHNMKGGSRRRQISRIRKRSARELIERYGIPMAMIARETGVATTAISKLMADDKVH